MSNKNLSCRKQIARQLRRQYVEGIYRPKYYTVTLKTRLSVTQCHWKRYHWIDRTRLTISRVIWRWILSWPWNVCQRSLKVIKSGTIWKFGYNFLFAFHSNYDHLAILDIFSVKEWPDLEIWVWSCSRSFKMVLFDRPCVTFHWSAIVTIALSCTIFDLFDVE